MQKNIKDKFMNKKDLKRSYFRILKFMLIGIVPNLLLYFFLGTKLPSWLLTILSMLIFIACGFLGEAIYLKLRNKEVLEELDKEENEQKGDNN